MDYEYYDMCDLCAYVHMGKLSNMLVRISLGEAM